MNKVREYERDSKISPSERISTFSGQKLTYTRARALVEAVANDVQSAEATDAEINLLVDEMEETASVEQTTTSKKGEDGSNLPTPLQKYFMATLLLSKLVRNNELVDNEALKLRALNKAVDAWCCFASEGWIIFDTLVAGTAPAKLQGRYDAIAEKDLPMVEFTLKCVLGVIISMIAQDSIGTEKLLLVLNKSYDETDSTLVLKRLILIQILLFLGFSSPRCPPETIVKATNFIKTTKHDSTLMLLSLSLYGTYMQPFLGTDNRKLLEGLMLELLISQNAAGSSASARNKLKTVLLPRLQQLRQKNEESEKD